MLRETVSCCKARVGSWLGKVFQEQKKDVKVATTLVITSLVLIHAFSFKDQLTELVKGLWNNLITAA